MKFSLKRSSINPPMSDDVEPNCQETIVFVCPTFNEPGIQKGGRSAHTWPAGYSSVGPLTHKMDWQYHNLQVGLRGSTRYGSAGIQGVVLSR
jgi:hypothetical protein